MTGKLEIKGTCIQTRYLHRKAAVEEVAAK